jgi:cysteine desulfurase
MTERVYLDHNATSPLRPEARAAMVAALDRTGNASSVHAEGRAARAVVEEARRDVAALVAAPDAEVVFTSGGTEANNLALVGVARANDVARIIISAVEHESARHGARAAGLQVDVAPVTADGVVDLDALAALLDAAAGEIVLVSVMLANNETGVIQPVAEIAKLTRAHGNAILHTDAVQAAGKIAVDFTALGVDALSLSAHKIGGPQGVGALVLRKGLALTPFFHGGRQEMARRAGTETVAGIAGFGAAARAALAGLDDMAALARLRDSVEQEIAAMAPAAAVFGQTAPRLPNTSCFATPGLEAELQVMSLDLAGIAVSSGAACSSGKVSASQTLTAMGADEETARSAIRVSLGWSTKQEDVRAFIKAWRTLNDRVTSKARGHEPKAMGV